MSNSHSVLDSITNAFVPIHRDGYKFVLAAALATLVLFLLAHPHGWLAAIETAWCAYFFRDPDRVTPARKGLVVSAADGKISCKIGRASCRESGRMGGGGVCVGETG